MVSVNRPRARGVYQRGVARDKIMDILYNFRQVSVNRQKAPPIPEKQTALRGNLKAVSTGAGWFSVGYLGHIDDHASEKGSHL